MLSSRELISPLILLQRNTGKPSLLSRTIRSLLGRSLPLIKSTCSTPARTYLNMWILMPRDWEKSLPFLKRMENSVLMPKILFPADWRSKTSFRPAIGPNTTGMCCCLEQAEAPLLCPYILRRSNSAITFLSESLSLTEAFRDWSRQKPFSMESIQRFILNTYTILRLRITTRRWLP